MLKFTKKSITIPAPLYAEIEKQAQSQGISVSRWITNACQQVFLEELARETKQIYFPRNGDKPATH